MRAWRVERNASSAAAAYARVVEITDGWRYMEPPRWYYPPRVCLGLAQLLADGDAAALATFKADLEAYPENGWSLFGASVALAALGQAGDAAAMRVRSLVAWQEADVPLESPCPQLDSSVFG